MKPNKTPDLPSNSNLSKAGPTTGIPETTKDNELVEEIPDSSVGDVPQADYCWYTWR